MDIDKLFNNIDISKTIRNGNEKREIICSKCSKHFTYKLFYKNNTSKITIVECPHCKHKISKGNIFNFTTGNNLSNKIPNNFNQNTIDNKEWNIKNTK